MHMYSREDEHEVNNNIIWNNINNTKGLKGQITHSSDYLAKVNNSCYRCPPADCNSGLLLAKMPHWVSDSQ